MEKFSAQTEMYLDEETGQVTWGGAARNKRIADAGGQDVIQSKAYQSGYADGYKQGFEEGREFGAAQAYELVDERLKRIEQFLMATSR